MKFIQHLLGTIWKTYFLLCLVITLLLFYPFYRVWLFDERYFRRGFKLIRFHSLLLLILGCVPYRIENKLDLEKDKTYIFIANHTSYLDILLFYRICPNYFVFMAKKELSNVPLFNIFFKKMNILIDRKSVKDSHKAYESAREELRKGNNLVIFPQGGIPDKVPHLTRFKSGAFKLAVEEKVSIIPITFINNWKLMQDNHYFWANSCPGLAKVFVHEPINTEKMSEDDFLLLQKNCFDIIYNKLEAEKLFDDE